MPRIGNEFAGDKKSAPDAPTFTVSYVQEITRVVHSPEGEHMLRVCFGAIADHFAEMADGTPRRRFTYEIDPGNDPGPNLHGEEFEPIRITVEG